MDKDILIRQAVFILIDKVFQLTKNRKENEFYLLRYALMSAIRELVVNSSSSLEDATAIAAKRLGGDSIWIEVFHFLDSCKRALGWRPLLEVGEKMPIRDEQAVLQEISPTEYGMVYRFNGYDLLEPWKLGDSLLVDWIPY